MKPERGARMLSNTRNLHNIPARFRAQRALVTLSVLESVASVQSK